MMSKDHILSAVRRHKPNPLPLPEIPNFYPPTDDLIGAFKVNASLAKSTVLELTHWPSDAQQWLQEQYHGKQYISRVSEIKGSVALDDFASARSLDGVDLAILKAQIGVAENGACWVSEQELGIRVLPFIVQHLVILIDPHTIVPHMHVAYDRIHIDETGFGVFIAGPSKTADIEQSLVIGAQGARSLTYWILPG